LTTAEGKKWNVVSTDYIVRDFKGELSVYKAPRFEAEFREVVPQAKGAFTPKVQPQIGTLSDVQKFGEVKTNDSVKKDAQDIEGKGIAPENKKFSN